MRRIHRQTPKASLSGSTPHPAAPLSTPPTMGNIVTRCIAIASLLISANTFADALDTIHEKIKREFDVQHISHNALAKVPASDIILFDVRRLKEYKVSHIEHAIHLEPGTSTDDFFQQYADTLNNKVVVFYCSVGQRSSKMLAKLNHRLTQMGVEQAYNLEGGVFRSHNNQSPLISEGKSTRAIHPYNAYWGRLIDDKASISYR